MNPSMDEQLRLPQQQVFNSLDNSPLLRNALKHGLRAASILLPNDDAEEFHQLRRDLFQTYRPRTGDEAACVEAMATCHWRIGRCRRWQAVLDAQVDATLFPDAAPPGHICEPDSHRWQHKADDCTRQEIRLDRLLCRARDKLLLLQKLRRNQLIAGAIEQEPIFWSSEASSNEATSHSGDGAIGENAEQTRQSPRPRQTPPPAGKDVPLACEGDRPLQRPGGVPGSQAGAGSGISSGHAAGAWAAPVPQRGSADVTAALDVTAETGGVPPSF